VSSALSFELPARLEAHGPPPQRDRVRMLVLRRETNELLHARFDELPRFVRAGDLLVVNTSATLPAALEARRADRSVVDLHLSTPVPGEDGRWWVVELRRAGGPFTVHRSESFDLAAAGRVELLAPYLAGKRLWIARLDLPEPVATYLARHGRPIRYGYVSDEHPLAEYQTVFALEPGSAEMPSAGRPFTPEIVTALVARGALVAPVVLHTGVSSPEHSEAPFPERFRVPESTARLATAVHGWGGRVIAVGTTVVRALESAAGPDGSVDAAEGWTDLVITSDRGLRVVDGLLTGWHEPESSHLQLLDAVAGRELVARSYRAALERGYLWHEFGDIHLILP
jgi:S-adenosylmethionine:tRNA ribosyltransferase-isomerase